MTYYAHFRNTAVHPERTDTGILDVPGEPLTTRQVQQKLADSFGVELDLIKVLEWAVLQ